MPPMLEQRIEQHFIDSADLKYQSAQVLSKPIAAAVQALMVCVTSGGKVLACGNGGSGTVAQSFAAGFVGGFERDRPELAAIALATDSATLTAIANGHAFSSVFSRQVRALGGSGDVLLAISADGNCRPTALMMPVVIELARPNGLPIAIARWPTRTSSELANVTGSSRAGSISTRTTARSLY